jgi:hypothetical protein
MMERFFKYLKAFVEAYEDTTREISRKHYRLLKMKSLKKKK